MAGISGWIFVAIGSIVSLFSNYVRNRGGGGMALFFWVGIGMIGVGIFKLAAGYILNEKKTKEETERIRQKNFSKIKFGFNKDLEEVNGKEVEQEKQKAMNKINDMGIIVCQICGTKHYSNSNFCHMCGSRLK